MGSFLYFFSWYYTTAIVDGIYIAGNYCWNVLRVFSVREISRTLFAPYHRTTEEVPSFFVDIGAFFEGIVGNMISRVLGFFVRLFILAFALISFIFVLVFAAIVMSVWVILPLLVPYLFIQSIEFLI